MPMSEDYDFQRNCFPLPETVLLHLRRLIKRVLTISPELTSEECLALLRNLAILDVQVDRLEYTILNSAMYKARQEYEASRLMDELKRNVGDQADPGALTRAKRQRPAS